MMRRTAHHYRWIGALLALFLPLALLAGAAPAQAATGSISGTVLNPDGTPAAGIGVGIAGARNANDPAVGARSTFADASGYWSIDAVTPGTYVVGFVGAFSRVTFAYGKYTEAEADWIVVGSGPVVVNNTIPPETTVRGTITDAAGVPKVDISVELVSSDQPDGNTGSGYTLPDGTFQIAPIATAGSYFLRVSDPAGRYAPQSGPPFDIAVGQQVTGQDFSLSVGAVIRGRAIDRLTGKPIDFACPYARFGRTNVVVAGSYSHCSDASGRWEISALPAGKFTVKIYGGDTNADGWAKNARTQRDATVYRVSTGQVLRVGAVKLRRAPASGGY